MTTKRSFRAVKTEMKSWVRKPNSRHITSTITTQKKNTRNINFTFILLRAPLSHMAGNDFQVQFFKCNRNQPITINISVTFPFVFNLHNCFFFKKNHK